MTRHLLFFILAATLILSCLTSWSRAEETFIIVVHQKNPVPELTVSEIKHIFLGKKRNWPDGSSITLVMNKNDEIHESFTRTMLQKSPTQLSVYWKKILYSGASMLPLAVKDDEAVKSYLHVHANAISYIASDSLDKQVRQVKIKK